MKSIDFPKSYKNLPRASHTHLSNIPSLIKCYGGSIDITYRCVESELLFLLHPGHHLTFDLKRNI